MNVAIDFCGAIRLELGLERQGDGLVINKAFGKFPGRPAAPHLSLLPEAKAYDLHFTARHGRPDVFRRKLEKISYEGLTTTAERLEVKMATEYAGALRPADLVAMERDGWVACGAILPALGRWARLAARRSSEFHYDAAVVEKLALHVLRHWCLPTCLQQLPPAARRLVAVRDAERQEDIAVLPLVFFPHGYATLKHGRFAQTHPPGWYTHPFEWTAEQTFQDGVPMARVERMFEKTRRYLAYFPQRGAATPDLDGLPLFVRRLGAYYSVELLEAALRARVDVVDEQAASSPVANSKSI